MQEKLSTVALLRCVGVQTRQTLAIYLLQAISMGVAGGLLGILVGLIVQIVLPALLHDFLPVNIALIVSWRVLLQGLLVSLTATLLFALPPLLSVRHVSPLLALRSAYESEEPSPFLRDPLRLTVIGLIALSIGLFVFAHTDRWLHGVWFCVGLVVTFGLLAGVAKLLITVVRNAFPASWPYVWRQGLANLYRPHNQTLVLILSLGAGTFFLMTLYLAQQTLLQQVRQTHDESQPNLVLFDIQSDQREALTTLMRSLSLPVIHDIPLVTMRLATIKGKNVADLRNSEEGSIPDWALQWEYRATYRPGLLATETLATGVWQEKVASTSDPIPISLEDELARTLAVSLGDEVTFDVQGVPVTTVVSSTRKVDWQRVQPNFFVVFPVGVLESAPQTYVLFTKTLSTEQSAAVQRSVIQRFPNVSAIDLTFMLATLETILNRIAFAIRFMAFFSIVAGFMVLLSTILTTRAQRRKESALLQILGASQPQLHRILAIEYLLIGSLAAVTGLLLAWVASWGFAHYFFAVSFVPVGSPFLVALVAVIGITVLTGMFGSRGFIPRSPLEVVRSSTL
jgi:putative ABC transport system permease protein